MAVNAGVSEIIRMDASNRKGFKIRWIQDSLDPPCSPCLCYFLSIFEMCEQLDNFVEKRPEAALSNNPNALLLVLGMG
jgi:hypothetical protein